MKISHRWLEELVPGAPAAADLAARLTMAGLEVEGIDRPGAALEGVVVARIVAAAAHPDADKLSVTQVDAGGPPIQVVCGAKNFQVGDCVPLAPVGVRLPGGVDIQKATLRGVESAGMLCSARELGLSEEGSGLLILPADAVPGTPVARVLGLDDSVLEVNVTPNRPDALSHVGIAREVAVLEGLALHRQETALSESGAPASAAVRIRIEDPVGCPRYAARVIEGVRIGPSPAWIARRLQACGVRSINNVVDATNYVLLESGQPLHGFDLDHLAGHEIVVRRARPGESLTSLDGKARALDPGDLLVCDRDRPQALAGVMGGADAEVTPGTTRVLLECAHFQPATVRRMAKRHQLHTEASHRFERGVDIENVGAVVDRAAALIAELSGGTVRAGRVDVYPRPVEARTVLLRVGHVGRLLGAEVPEREVQRILTALGFSELARGPEGTTWAVPTWRVDVERPEDLIEEVARIRGYDAIPASLPGAAGDLRPDPPELEVERRVRSALGGAGLDEVVNYSFADPGLLPQLAERPLERLGEAVEAIALQNPLTPEQAVMRTTLYASLLPNLLHNLRQGVDGLRLYELGRVYLRDPGGGQSLRPVAREVQRVAGLLWGRRALRAWTSDDARVDFYDAKGVTEAVLETLGIAGGRMRLARLAPYHPRACAEWVTAEGRVLGAVGELHPRAARALGAPEGVFLFSLKVDALVSEARLVRTQVPLNRFPAVFRDLAVVVPRSMPAEEVRSVVREVGGALVEEATVFDVYTGKPLPEGQKNLAFALRYRAPDRTLRDEEVAEAHARIVEEVNRRLGGRLRS